MKYILFSALLILIQFFIDVEILAFGGKSPENQSKENQTTSSTSEGKKIERCLCPMIFMPVCGEDQKTYPNSCQATCAGVKVNSPGECPETK